MDALTGFKTRSVLCIPVRSRDGVLLAVLQVGAMICCCKKFSIAVLVLHWHRIILVAVASAVSPVCRFDLLCLLIEDDCYI